MTELSWPESPSPEAESQILTDAILQRLLRQVRMTVHADTAALLLLDESKQFLVATAADGIEEEVHEGSRVRAGEGFAGRIAAERVPVVLEQITPHNVVNPLLLRRGIVSMAGVPLFWDRAGSGDVLGVLHVGSLTRRTFNAKDLASLEQAARGVGAAIARQRVFIDRAAASALQTSLTPRLPDIDGLQLAARYVPGSRYGVGGDWYDVFTLPSGGVGVTIGDVMGHGLHAATVMGRARSALRAYALLFDDPATVLDRLDRKIQHFEPGLIGTVAYGLLDPENGRLLISLAGHLRPIIGGIGTPARQLDAPVDPPIGVRGDHQRHTTAVTLEPGALMCLFTDGLVERRTADIDVQLEQLCRVLSGAFIGSAEAACAEIMTSMLHGRNPGDDVSLLTVSRQAAPNPN